MADNIQDLNEQFQFRISEVKDMELFYQENRRTSSPLS